MVDPRTRAPGVVFVPARLEDNPYIDRETYLENLKRLDPVNWQRLAFGDWTVRDPGEIFDRHRVGIVNFALGTDARRVRRWDLAATAVDAGSDPDWTVGILVAYDPPTGQFLIEDLVRLRESPAKVEDAIRAAALRDGRQTPIVIEQEPGSSGKGWFDHIRRNVLPGFHVTADRVRDPKAVRIRALQPVVEHKDLSVVAAQWNGPLLDEMDAWPNVQHDDQVDALAGAHSYLTRGVYSGVMGARLPTERISR
jgi:predicted phage terminase large subunit-like protein